MKGKVALILTGGGMRCAYGAGVLSALGKIGRVPDLIIAASGSAGGACYFLAGQYDSIRRIWTELLSTSRFISLLRRPIMDIDYLIDSVFRKQEPLKDTLVAASSITLFLPLASLDTGSLVYMSNKDGKDLFEMLRATKAMPLIYGKPVFLDGIPFADGQVIASLSEHVEKAVAEGAEKIVIVDNTPPIAGTKLIFFLYALLSPAPLRTSMKAKIKGLRTQLASRGIELLRITPSHSPVDTLGRSATRLRNTFEMGFQEAMTNARLREILSP